MKLNRRSQRHPTHYSAGQIFTLQCLIVNKYIVLLFFLSTNPQTNKSIQFLPVHTCCSYSIVATFHEMVYSHTYQSMGVQFRSPTLDCLIEPFSSRSALSVSSVVQSEVPGNHAALPCVTRITRGFSHSQTPRTAGMHTHAHVRMYHARPYCMHAHMITHAHPHTGYYSHHARRRRK